MKAINNATGEIVSHFFYSKEFGTISYIDSKNILRVVDARDGEWTILSHDKDMFCGYSYRINDMEEAIIQEPFDWQPFRTEAAKDILCAMIQGGYYGEDRIVHQSELAVGYANELCKQLKEKEEK